MKIVLLLLSLFIFLRRYVNGFFFPHFSGFDISKFSSLIDHIIISEIFIEQKYDFIVVGAGASGAVVANRLSEIPSWNILLLEVGERAGFLTTVPMASTLLQLSHYNWNYTMEPQKGLCMAMKEETCLYPRGKALGGSTVINYMVYTRGNPEDYSKWAAAGNDGWSYEEVLPYFLKAEKCRLGEDCNNKFHNKSGLMSVEYIYESKLGQAFVKAGTEAGYKNTDYNTPPYVGFSRIQANEKFGRRDSTADSYLNHFEKKRKNLHIVTSATVTKILIDPMSKEAYGVTFIRNKKEYTVNASKEVILSAGVFNSPQLLMLSGVGPKPHLDEMNISLIHNLPVGQLLYDHVAYYGLAFKINHYAEPILNLVNPIQIFKWLFEGKGFYTSLSGIEAIGYVNVGSNANRNYPDIELLFNGLGSVATDFDIITGRQINLKPYVYNKVFRPIALKPQWTVLATLLHPKSRGFLKLRSTNPLDKPRIFGNFFSDAKGEDIATMLSAIRFIQKLNNMEALKAFGSTLSDIPMVGCEHHAYDSDYYWICCLRSMTTSLHHQTGTCKMGPPSDKEAVVDPRLKVHGIKRLRVVDASVIPVTLSAHTGSPSVMVGEKASDIIKEDWK